MSVLLEWYESGSAPHEALGRAARRLARGGALYLGGGIGVEKRSTPKGDAYDVTTAAGGKAAQESFAGPLSAAMRGYALAGASTDPSTPGGTTAVADPAAAARLSELGERLRSIQDDIERYTRRLAAQQTKAAQSTWSPVGGVSIEDDDRWERRRVAELRVEQAQVEAERTRLLAGTPMQEVEQARPGTNFTKIPPKNVARLRGIIDHYKGMAHPFTACVRDQVKHGLSQDHANRRCAVVKDLGQGTTKWRKGAKSGKVAEGLLTGALGRVEAVEEALGVGAAVELAEQGAPAGAGRTLRELVEVVTADLALLAVAEHPVGLLVFPLAEAVGFSEHLHPRDLMGRFRGKVGGLKPRESAELPDGTRVVRAPTTEPKFYVHGKTSAGPTTASTPEQATKRAMDLSAQHTDEKSVGGPTRYANHLSAIQAHDRNPSAATSKVAVAQRKRAGEEANRALDPLKVGDSTKHGELTITRRPDAGGKARFDVSGPGVPKGGAQSVTAGEAMSWMKERGAAKAVPAPGGSNVQSGVAGRRRRVPGGTATRTEATAASRKPSASPAGSPEWLTPPRKQLLDDFGIDPKVGGGKPVRVLPRSAAWNEAVTRADPRGLSGNAQETNEQLARRLSNANQHTVIVDDAKWNEREKRRGAASATPERDRSGGTAPAGVSRSGLAAPGGDAGGDAARTRIASTLGALPQGGRYSIVNGQGNPVGHVAKTAQGFEVVTSDGIKSYATPRAAAMAVDKFERTARARAQASQQARGRRRGLRESEPQGIAMLVEGFSSGEAQWQRPDQAARRQVGKRKPGEQGKGGGSGKFDEAKHKRGQGGTPQGGRFVTKGATGEDVRAVQRKVGAKSDGKFGPKTEAAIRQFQAKHGLQVDGVVGHQTAVALAGGDAKSAKVGAMKGSDHAKLKAMRRGTRGRSGKRPRARGGVTV